MNPDWVGKEMTKLEPDTAGVMAKMGTSMRKFALQSDVAVAGRASRKVFVELFSATLTRLPPAAFSGT
jgi:hypothetical protein